MTQRLLNKIALITGAAQGIGEAICRRFAEQGATVIVTDILEAEGQKLAEQIGGHFFYLDVADETSWQQVTDAVKQRFGRLDVLVNNAGITGLAETESQQDPEHFDLHDWRHVHAVNLDGTALGCKYAIGLMKSSAAASIINISSRSGLVGIPGAAAYASSKAAMRNHTKSVALHCAAHGYPIRCNSIHPAAIMTPIWDAMLGTGPDRAAAIKAVEQGIPVGHMGEPDDVAFAAVFLAADESKYITGTELNIDGGILAGSSSAPSAHADD